MGCLTFFMFGTAFMLTGVFMTVGTAYVAALITIMGMYMTFMMSTFGAFVMFFLM